MSGVPSAALKGGAAIQPGGVSLAMLSFVPWGGDCRVAQPFQDIEPYSHELPVPLCRRSIVAN